MSALPPELAAPVEQLRAKLVEINDSEQNCMTHVVASAPQGKLPGSAGGHGQVSAGRSCRRRNSD
jgi:hypothetical protein